MIRLIETSADLLPNDLRYRRGYLLYGPPGTGKTSLTMALAGYFDLPIYMISLSSPRLNDSKLHCSLNSYLATASCYSKTLTALAFVARL